MLFLLYLLDCDDEHGQSLAQLEVNRACGPFTITLGALKRLSATINVGPIGEFMICWTSVQYWTAVLRSSWRPVLGETPIGLWWKAQHDTKKVEKTTYNE